LEKEETGGKKKKKKPQKKPQPHHHGTEAETLPPKYPGGGTKRREEEEKSFKTGRGGNKNTATIRSPLIEKVGGTNARTDKQKKDETQCYRKVFVPKGGTLIRRKPQTRQKDGETGQAKKNPTQRRKQGYQTPWKKKGKKNQVSPGNTDIHGR